MTLADQLRDIIARDDAAALRLFVRQNSAAILAGLHLLRYVDEFTVPREPIGAVSGPSGNIPYKHLVRSREPRDDEVGMSLYAAPTAGSDAVIGLRPERLPREPVACIYGGGCRSSAACASVGHCRGAGVLAAAKCPTCDGSGTTKYGEECEWCHYRDRICSAPTAGSDAVIGLRPDGSRLLNDAPATQQGEACGKHLWCIRPGFDKRICAWCDAVEPAPTPPDAELPKALGTFLLAGGRKSIQVVFARPVTQEDADALLALLARTGSGTSTDKKGK
jgi:hypothetical protein